MGNRHLDKIYLQIGNKFAKSPCILKTNPL